MTVGHWLLVIKAWPVSTPSTSHQNEEHGTFTFTDLTNPTDHEISLEGKIHSSHNRSLAICTVGRGHCDL